MPPYLLLFVPDIPRLLPCQGKGRGKTNYPSRDRQTHYERVSRAFEAAWKQREQLSAVTVFGKKGLYLEIKGAAGYDLATKSLGSSRDTYSLLNVRHVGSETERTTIATIYIPSKNKAKFVKKLDEYATKLGKGGQPQNAALIESIEEITMAVLDDFWTDDLADIPQEDPTWCEIWLRDNHDKSAFRHFATTAASLRIEYNPRARLTFPERTVALARINRANFHQLLIDSPDVAECRLAREPAAFFTELPPREQAEWVTEFLKKAQFTPDPQVSVCVLDAGVNNGHPLLNPVLHDNDLHTAAAEWGTHDHHPQGHGTGMAGIAAYGNLAEALAAPSAVRVNHCLESSKILAPKNDSPPELYGFITAQGIAHAEDAAPQRKRQICMAVTGDSPFAQRGEPSSWSAAIDALASGANAPRSPKRLILISAGNTSENEFHLYDQSNLTQSVQDPAQAWNALTVGAYTALDKPDPSLGYKALASRGQLSPYSTTSSMWPRQWPAKPDVLFEGGNIAVDAEKNWNNDERLSVLTTSHRTPFTLLKPFHSTSAATAEAAWFAAQVQTAYPDAWPETIRALMVHSAEWTPAMRRQFTNTDNKKQLAVLRRICGYGVPSLDRALYCKNNSLVLVAERELQPYIKKENGDYGMQMHLFELPWPLEALKDLGEVPVTLRITLSYFIEPGPGQRGWKDKYRYASHGLRFEVCGPQEEEANFIRRISLIQAEEEDTESPRTVDTSGRWTIGINGRSSGSVHSDFWKGTAAEIATCNHIAVFPVVGWWRERTHLKKMENITRYSLIVSLHTEAQNVDIYTPVKLRVETAVKTPVPVPV